MKTAAFLLPLLLLACAHGLPRHPGFTSSEQEVRRTLVAPPLVEDVEMMDDGELTRARRSPFQPQRSPRPGPQPAPQQPQQPQPRGTISGGVHRERGVGTVVHAQGQGNVWRSRDARTSVDAQGEWRRVVRGPARGRPNYNVGVRFSHRW